MFPSLDYLTVRSTKILVWFLPLYWLNCVLKLQCTPAQTYKVAVLQQQLLGGFLIDWARIVPQGYNNISSSCSIFSI